MYYYPAPKPLGYLAYELDSVGLVQTIVFTDILPSQALPALAPFSTAFDSYFKNQQAFPMDLLSQNLGGTEFQRAIWRAIAEIPAGTTLTYTELATWVWRPSAARAAGTACGKNPVALAIPCHRVVRTSGEDYGYSWGFERKKWLLKFEGIKIDWVK
jgi:methylated-DNA-[protein]-cysteine S-methyltransferase